MGRPELLKFGLLTITGLLIGLADASAQSAIKIRLDWKGGAQHAPLYFGKQLGYYKESGIDLEVISGSGSSDTVKQVGARAVEFGLVDALVLVQAAQQRVPIKAVAAYYQRSPIVLISPKDRPITEPRQLLSGVKVGSKKASATYQGLIALLSSNNLKLEQINLVDIGFGVAPLLVKQVDAIMGFSMNEPIEAESSGMEVHVMPIADYGVDTYGLTIVANTNLMQQNPALIKNFLSATERAIQATLKDPAGAVAAVVKAVEEVDAARETKVLARTAPYWSSKQTEQGGFGWQSEAHWKGTIDIARKLGLIETALKPEDVFVNTFLQGSPQAN